jgi:hypothetical protein
MDTLKCWVQRGIRPVAVVEIAFHFFRLLPSLDPHGGSAGRGQGRLRVVVTNSCPEAR